MSAVVLVTDPMGGDRAFYVDGELAAGLEEGAAWDDALEEVFKALGVDFDTQGRYMVGVKHWTPDGDEYDSVWPQRLEDTHPDDRGWGAELTASFCGQPVALYGVAYGDLHEPCQRPVGHDGSHSPLEELDSTKDCDQ